MAPEGSKREQKDKSVSPTSSPGASPRDKEKERDIDHTAQTCFGRMWESSYNRLQPHKVVVGSEAYFKGLEEALQRMYIGEKAVVYVAPRSGYGSRGFPGKVPPDSHLILWLCVEERTEQETKIEEAAISGV